MKKKKLKLMIFFNPDFYKSQILYIDEKLEKESYFLFKKSNSCKSHSFLCMDEKLRKRVSNVFKKSYS